MKGTIIDDELTVTDSLKTINTSSATEFSPFIDPEGRYIIFTRYLEGEKDQQGFFISYADAENEWKEPKKIQELEYGWSARLIDNDRSFIYTDGKDIKHRKTSDLEIFVEN